MAKCENFEHENMFIAKNITCWDAICMSIMIRQQKKHCRMIGLETEDHEFNDIKNYRKRTVRG